ncbi:MAG: S8 family serine peptidase, partial [Nanoarchaeota archaeon]|nr:S8 family serine peptidase [Nanoarchaeota archaeon]
MIFFKKLKFSLLLIIALLAIANSLADEYVSFDSYDDLARALGSFDAEQTTQSFSLELKNSYNDTQNFEYLSFPKIGSKMFNLKIKNESLNVFVNQDNSKHSEDNYNYLKIDNSIFEEMNTLDEDSVQVIIKLNLKVVDEKEAIKRVDIKSTKTFFDKPLVDENELKKIRFEIAKERVVSVLNRKGETNSIRTINSLATSLNRDELKSISHSEYVDKIYLDYKTKTFLDDSVDIIKANDVWNLTDRNGNFITGKNITVAVLDSGIDYTHMDFGSCTAIGPNCRVIDGYDFINNDYDPMDDEGHGTHVAGIIAANSLAIKGVAPDAKLIAYKTTDENGGGLSSHLLMAIERAIDPNQDGDTSDHYDIITTSTGYDSSSTYDYISTMIDAAVETGVIFIAAAGNDGNPPGKGDNVDYPAAYDSVIAVAATDKNDKRASWSSTGPAVELAAPGVDIESTW